MATYTPVALTGPAALTASAGTSVFTGTAAHEYIIRTIHVSTSASGKTFRMSIKADAAGTRLFDDVAITQSVPSIYERLVAVRRCGRT